MIINKFGFILGLLSFLCLASFSTGFDLYAHSVIYYIYDYPNTHAYLLFEKIVMPRYLLLSYIYEITRRLGIPIGIVVVTLVTYPVYNMGRYISSNIKKGTLSISQIFIVASIVILSFFYSGLSLVLLWLMALLVSKKKIFLVGILFHPLGLVLGGLLCLFFRSYLKHYIIIVLTFLAVLYLLTIQEYFTSSMVANIKYEILIDNEETVDLLRYSYERKVNEFYAMFLILVFAYLSKTKLRSLVSYIKKISFPRVLVLSLFFTLITAVNFYFISKGRHSLIIDTVSLNLSAPVYYTWYDWGIRDISGSKQSLILERDN